MTFTQFWEECASMFGTRSRKPCKMVTTISTNAFKTSTSVDDQLVKSADQFHRKKKAKVKTQAEQIELQKGEIENLKAASSKQLDPKSLEAIMLVMICM